MSSSEIHLDATASLGGPAESSKRPTFEPRKPRPNLDAIDRRLVYSYEPSSDGIDTNLLILLHGRGDNEAPFAKLGKSLSLPQTATLALRGPLVVPLLDEHEREWWNETDMLGMDIPNTDPSKAISFLINILEELTKPRNGWSFENIHLFGFAQGGTLAVEVGTALAKKSKFQNHLGSIVTISGPLLSSPTSSNTANQTSTPLLYFSGRSSKRLSHLTALKRAYSSVETYESQSQSSGPSMPRNKQEWEPIMRFWSERMKRKMKWELQAEAGDGQIYEISKGTASNVPVPAATPASARAGESSVESHPSAASKARAEASPPVKAETGKKSAKGSTGGIKKGFLL